MFLVQCMIIYVKPAQPKVRDTRSCSLPILASHSFISCGIICWISSKIVAKVYFIVYLDYSIPLSLKCVCLPNCFILIAYYFLFPKFLYKHPLHDSIPSSLICFLLFYLLCSLLPLLYSLSIFFPGPLLFSSSFLQPCFCASITKAQVLITFSTISSLVLLSFSCHLCDLHLLNQTSM